MATKKPVDDWDWFDQRMLGAGEFVTTGENSTVAPATQRTFMRAIVYWAPEVLEEAADSLLESYIALRDLASKVYDDALFRIDEQWIDPFLHHKEGTVGDEFRELFMPKEFHRTVDKKLYIDHYLEMREEFEPHITAFRTALGTWMAKYRLPYLWILDGLLFSLGVLESRSGNDDAVRPLEAFDSFFGTPGLCQGHPLLTNEMDLQIKISYAYDPLFMDRQRAIEHSRNEALRQLEEFFDGIDDRMDKGGYVRSRKKRNPQHFLMVVDRQVRGHTWREIAETFEVDQRSAIVAVQDLAKVMKLDLYQGKRGRPSTISAASMM